MTHVCHAIDCSTVVPPDKLFCRRHWFMLPSDIRRAVYANYRSGQCDDKKPSEEWKVAARDAIAYVAEREGKIAKS